MEILKKEGRKKAFGKTAALLSACLLSALLMTSCTQAPESFIQSEAKEASLFNGKKSSENRGAAKESKNSLPENTRVIPLGTTFGIKLFTDGIIVASLTEVQSGDGNVCPAELAGIQAGDYIVSVNGKELAGNTELAAVIGESKGETLNFVVRRGDGTFETTITPVFSGGSFRTGMWVRDSAAGIGTLTFYNPKEKVFAGLGHGILDMDTKGLMTLDHGEPAEITLCGIVPGTKDNPGQLQGYFASDRSLGKLYANNETGVYGYLDEAPTGELMEVMPKEEVEAGDVKILVSVDETGPKLYDAKIERINPKDQPTQNMVVSITDEELLEQTGGIVQGMSGCPIIQDGKLAGAVTHVFVDDPKTGYGIYSETMVMESVVFSMSE